MMFQISTKTDLMVYGLNQAAERLSDRDGENDNFYEILWIMKMSRMGKTEEEWQRWYNNGENNQD